MPDRRECLAALGGLALAACNRQRKRRIAVIPKGTSHIFWISVQSGAEAAGKEFDVEILWNGPAQETEFSRQFQIIDSMAAQHVDGIAVAAAERQAVVAPVERAVKAGIPVVVFDSALDSNQYLSYIATDNVEAGRLAARSLAGMLQGKGKVGVVMHAPGSASTTDREVGFKEVIDRDFTGIKIVASQFSMSDRAKARAAAENILTAHPDLSGIFASSEPSSVGAALAIKARQATGTVSLVAFDSSDTMIEDLRAGAIDSMVVQDPYRMGYEAVKAIVDKLAGKTPPKRLDLNARVVTAADLNEPEV
ncbi:MAG: substrate-binding domain-containing protein, partial [Bryobacteraceae bacterium]